MSSDPFLWGLGAWAALCVVGGLILRRPLPTIATWVAAGWGFSLLARNPYAAVTVLLAVGLWVVHRWGLRHLLLYGGLAFVFATIVWANISSGMLLPAALGNAAGRTVRFVVFAYAAFTLWRLATQRLGYLTNPLAWAAETRRVQQTAEHRRAMGLGKQGLGRLGAGTRRALTARRPDRPSPPDGPVVATVPATDHLGIPEPLFAPKPRRRRKR